MFFRVYRLPQTSPAPRCAACRILLHTLGASEVILGAWELIVFLCHGGLCGVLGGTRAPQLSHTILVSLTSVRAGIQLECFFPF